MKTLLAATLGFMLGVAAMSAVADSLNWTWTAPITRTDGTDFDMATEGAGYSVKFNGVVEMDPADPTAPLLLSAGANALTKAFPAGNVCAEFSTLDNDGRQSPWSAPVCKDVFAPPGEPTGVTVTIIIQ